MGSRKKKRQSYEDRISQLNDDMICHILSNLSTKDVIRTSLLSTRWRNLWQCVNALDLESNKFSSFENFAGFVDEFFDFHRDLSIQKVCLTLYDHVSSSSHLKSWIDIAIKRKIQRLYIRVDCGSFGDIPLRLYTCETLVRLYLTQINLVDTEFVSLPCLKILNLKHNHYPNDDILEKLILGSPVLEDLTVIIRNHFERAKPLLVPSRTLKRIHISKTVNVVIDAPLLQCLSAEFITSKTYRIIGSCFPNKVIIDFGYYVCFLSEADALQRRRMISNVLSEFSKVKELVIGCTLKDIYPNSESRPLLAFCSLTRLSIKLFCNTDLDLLPNLLTSCPKLESLILDTFKNICYVSGKKNKEPRVTLSMATPCMVSSLKFVELKIPIYGYDEEIELVRYFLKNSRILEKLSLRIKNNYRKKSKDRIVKELLAMPRCSSSCKLLVL